MNPTEAAMTWGVANTEAYGAADTQATTTYDNNIGSGDTWADVATEEVSCFDSGNDSW